MPRLRQRKTTWRTRANLHTDEVPVRALRRAARQGGTSLLPQLPYLKRQSERIMYEQSDGRIVHKGYFSPLRALARSTASGQVRSARSTYQPSAGRLELRQRVRVNYAETVEEASMDSSESSSESASAGASSEEEEEADESGEHSAQEQEGQETGSDAALPSHCCESKNCHGAHRWQFSFYNTLLADRHEQRGGLGTDISSMDFWGADYDHELAHLTPHQLERLQLDHKRRQGRHSKKILAESLDFFGDRAWLGHLPHWAEFASHRTYTKLGVIEKPLQHVPTCPQQPWSVFEQAGAEGPHMQTPYSITEECTENQTEEDSASPCRSLRVSCIPNPSQDLVLRVYVPVKHKPRKWKNEAALAKSIVASYASKLNRAEPSPSASQAALQLPPGYVLPIKEATRSERKGDKKKKRKLDKSALWSPSGGRSPGRHLDHRTESASALSYSSNRRSAPPAAPLLAGSHLQTCRADEESE
eukprot:g56473.t1